MELHREVTHFGPEWRALCDGVPCASRPLSTRPAGPAPNERAPLGSGCAQRRDNPKILAPSLSMWDTSIYFEHFDVGYGEYGSTLHATVHIDGLAPDPIGGWWFPADECDAAMTHCGFEDTSTD
jgi:hypothetical protein